MVVLTLYRPGTILYSSFSGKIISRIKYMQCFDHQNSLTLTASFIITVVKNYSNTLHQERVYVLSSIMFSQILHSDICQVHILLCLVWAVTVEKCILTQYCRVMVMCYEVLTKKCMLPLDLCGNYLLECNI